MTREAFDRKKVANILKDRGLTISEAAEKCGTSRPVLSQWLSGRRNPKRPAIQKIADALRINISEISTYHDDDLVTPPPVTDPLPEPNADAHSAIFAYVLAELRRQVALSGQVKTAEKIGISASQISLLLSGKADIRDIKLSAFLCLLPKMEIKFNSETDVDVADPRNQIKLLVDRMELEDDITAWNTLTAIFGKKYNM